MSTIKIKKHQELTDEEIGSIETMHDFLPPPDKLILKEETIKITLALKTSSVVFFKQKAKLHHTQYQKMIRALLDRYVEHCVIQQRKMKSRLVKSKKHFGIINLRKKIAKHGVKMTSQEVDMLKKQGRR